MSWLSLFPALLLVLWAMVTGMRTAVDGLAGFSGRGWAVELSRRPMPPLYSLAAGVLLTVAMQSSSAVTMVAVGLVGAGILSLRNAIPLMFGANIGTALTVQIFAHTPSHLGWYMAVAGWLTWFGFPKAAAWGRTLAGFGLIFIGLELLDFLLPPLAREGWFLRAIRIVSSDPWSGFWSGVVLTTLVMSSTVTIGLLQRLADQGLITVASALPMLYGDNVGTTTDTLMVSIGANRAGRQLALAHLLFNVTSTALFWFLTPWFGEALAWLSDSPAQQLAHAHFLFNFVNAVVQLPLTGGYISATEHILRFRFSICRTIPWRVKF